MEDTPNGNVAITFITATKHPRFLELLRFPEKKHVDKQICHSREAAKTERMSMFTVRHRPFNTSSSAGEQNWPDAE